MSNYKIIDGIRLSATMLEQATQLTQKAGDGRISLNDAEILMGMVKADNVLTDVERDTIAYLFQNYHWTPTAEEWFRKELKHWQSHKPPLPITIEELSNKHFAKAEVLTDAAALAERKHLLVSATSETNEDHDEIGLWIRLIDGTTVEVFSTFIELEGESVQLKGGCLVPVRAIEKVEM